MLDGKELMPWTCYRFINVCHTLMSKGKRTENITSYRFINVCHSLMSRGKWIDNITSCRFINVCHMLMSIGKRIKKKSRVMCYYMPRLHVLKYIWLLFSIVFLLPQMLYKRQLELNAVLHCMYILCVYIYFWSHKAGKVLISVEMGLH